MYLDELCDNVYYCVPEGKSIGTRALSKRARSCPIALIFSLFSIVPSTGRDRRPAEHRRPQGLARGFDPQIASLTLATLNARTTSAGTRPGFRSHRFRRRRHGTGRPSISTPASRSASDWLKRKFVTGLATAPAFRSYQKWMEGYEIAGPMPEAMIDFLDRCRSFPRFRPGPRAPGRAIHRLP